MAFEGFSKDTLAFLSELSQNNDKGWFDANRPRYQHELLDREKAFVSAMGERMRSSLPDLEAIPRVNGSIFRINRDTRFSNDKTPYKTYADMWMWEGEDRKASSGLFLRIEPKELWTGVGAHMLSKDGLKRMRAAIFSAKGAELEEIVGTLAGEGYEGEEPTLKRAPRGYAADHPRGDLLRLTSFVAMKREPIPSEFFSADLVEWCAQRYEEMLPLHRWLVPVLEG